MRLPTISNTFLLIIQIMFRDLYILCDYMFKLSSDQLSMQAISSCFTECGASIKLADGTNGSTVRLRSENYPHGSPSSSSCNYVVFASQHYIVNVTVSDIMLADNCQNSYLEVTTI